jgi:hypothetical protein
MILAVAHANRAMDLLMANDVMAYITANKTVAPKREGRIDLRM